MSIYERMKSAGVEIDSHATDLYVPVNDTTHALVTKYEHRDNVTMFVSQAGRLWFNIPFAYLPAWESRGNTV